MATAEHQFTGMQAVPATDWWSWVMRQGIFAGMLIAFSGWFGTAIIIPMRDDQRAFMQSVIETNKVNAVTVSKQTEIQQTQAQALKDIVPVLQQIRDDQRRGVWLDKAGNMP
jgi:hypothetical protein